MQNDEREENHHPSRSGTKNQTNKLKKKKEKTEQAKTKPRIFAPQFCFEVHTVWGTLFRFIFTIQFTCLTKLNAVEFTFTHDNSLDKLKMNRI